LLFNTTKLLSVSGLAPIGSVAITCELAVVNASKND
jgi:hypothetical protein